MLASAGLDRISIEVTNQCAKACWFCYNHSTPGGPTQWSASELVGFVDDCARNGIRFLTTCLDIGRVEFLASLGLDTIKVGSPDLTSRRMLEALRARKK